MPARLCERRLIVYLMILLLIPCRSLRNWQKSLDCENGGIDIGTTTISGVVLEKRGKRTGKDSGGKNCRETVALSKPEMNGEKEYSMQKKL